MGQWEPHLKRPGAGELRWSALLGVQGQEGVISPPPLGDAVSEAPSCSMRLL